VFQTSFTTKARRMKKNVSSTRHSPGYDFHTVAVGKNEMNLKRAVISVCTWIFTVALAAAAQGIAEERPPQTSPDTSVVEKGIKEKLESANPEARPPSPSKAFPTQSHSKSESPGSFKHRAHHESKSLSDSKAFPSRSQSRIHQRHRSHRHRSSRASEQLREVPDKLC
jgi:hypothetical protein